MDPRSLTPSLRLGAALMLTTVGATPWLAVGAGCAPDAKLAEPIATGGTTGSGAGGTGGAGGAATMGGAGGTGGGAGAAGGLSTAGQLDWAQGLSSDSGGVQVTAVASAPNGDILVGGSFTGVLTLGQFELQGAAPPGGKFDVFIARLTADGQVLWAKKWGTDTVFEQIWGIVADDTSVTAFGNVGSGAPHEGLPALSTIIAGHPLSWKGEILDNGGSVGEMYVARLDADGDPLWVLDPPEPSPSPGASRQLSTIALSEDGATIVVAGRIFGTGKTHESMTTPIDAAPLNPRAFVMALDAEDGGLGWVTALPIPQVVDATEPRHDAVQAAVSGGGQVLVGLAYEGKMLVTDATSTPTEYVADGIDSLALSLQLSNGSLVACRSYAGQGSQIITSTATGGTYLYVGGYYDDELDGAGAASWPASTDAQPNGFVVRYPLPLTPTSAEPDERRAFAGSDVQRVTKLAADSAGVYAAIEFNGTMDVAGHSFENLLGDIDLLVVGLTPATFPTWAVQFGGEGDQYQSDIALDDPAGVLLVGAHFTDSMRILDAASWPDGTTLAGTGNPNGLVATILR